MAERFAFVPAGKDEWENSAAFGEGLAGAEFRFRGYVMRSAA